jgi:chromosome segregation ATPase
VVQISLWPGKDSLTIDLSVNQGFGGEVRKQFLNQVVAKLPQVMRDAFEGARNEKTKVLREMQDTLNRVIDQQRARISELRAKLQAMSVRVDVSAASLRSAASNLEAERLRLALELIGLKARQEALEAAVASATKRAQEKVKVDEIAAQLQRIVAARSAALDRIRAQQASGVISAAEVEAADAHLAEARARLLERQSAASQTAGADLVGELNKELAMLSVRLAEIEARQKYVTKSLEDLRGPLSRSDELEQMESDAAIVGRELAAVNAKLRELVTGFSARPHPYVYVVKGRD